jgi:hypothetical protein
MQPIGGKRHPPLADLAVEAAGKVFFRKFTIDKIEYLTPVTPMLRFD